jgi:hypothetical protein
MDIPNAFVGKKENPSPKDLAAALGISAAVWQQLISSLAARYRIVDQEWSSYSPKAGWSLKLKLKKRTILYLVPCVGCFRTFFVLGEKAVTVARESKLSDSVLRLLEEARRYPEGTGLSLVIKNARDLSSVMKLVQIKLAN